MKRDMAGLNIKFTVGNEGRKNMIQLNIRLQEDHEPEL